MLIQCCAARRSSTDWVYKQRNRIERMVGELKINRAITTRYDQLASSFLGMVHLATARYWIKVVLTAYHCDTQRSGRRL